MATRRIETRIEINAPAKEVWGLLTDFARMPDWNPFIGSISGPLAVGSRLDVEIVPPGKSGMRFKPAIVKLASERELRWLGRVLLPGIFDGDHCFLLAPEVTQYRHRQDLSAMHWLVILPSCSQ